MIIVGDSSSPSTLTVVVPMEQLHWEHRQTISKIVTAGFNYPLLISHLLQTMVSGALISDDLWAKVYKTDNGYFIVTPEMIALAEAIVSYFADLLRNPWFREKLIAKGLVVDHATIKRYLTAEQAIVIEFSGPGTSR